MVNAWKPILAALVIFAAGMATGSLATRLRPTPDPSPPRWSEGSRGGPGGPRTYEGRSRDPDGRSRDMVQRLAGELELDPEQRDRIEILIKESQERVRLIADEVGPRFQSEFKRMNAGIRELLNPEQQAKFDEMLSRLDRRGRRPDRDGRPTRPEDGAPPSRFGQPPPGPPPAELNGAKPPG